MFFSVIGSEEFLGEIQEQCVRHKYLFVLLGRTDTTFQIRVADFSVYSPSGITYSGTSRETTTKREGHHCRISICEAACLTQKLLGKGRK